MPFVVRGPIDSEALFDRLHGVGVSLVFSERQAQTNQALPEPWVIGSQHPAPNVDGFPQELIAFLLTADFDQEKAEIVRRGGHQGVIRTELLSADRQRGPIVLFGLVIFLHAYQHVRQATDTFRDLRMVLTKQSAAHGEHVARPGFRRRAVSSLLLEVRQILHRCGDQAVLLAKYATAHRQRLLVQ